MILAVDIGTGSCKAVAVAGSAVAARRERHYPLRSPAPGQAEQDPAEVVSAVEAAVADAAAAGAVEAVVLSCAMHTLVALDDRGEPLTPVLTWADGRGGAQAAALVRSGEAAALWRRTGTPVHASSPLCKLLWLRAERGEVFARARRFASLKELLLRRWTDADVVDRATASATGLYALEAGDWDREALALCGIGLDRLAAVAEPTTVLPWRPGVAARLGLAGEPPLVLGATDGVLANVGAGAVDPGVVAVTAGTSAAARAVVPRPDVDPARGLFCYALAPGRFVCGGAVNNAGLVVRWLARELFEGDERAVFAAAERAEPGCRGLRCDPRLTGERFPDYDATPRGAFTGLALGHGRDDLARAALEGIARSIARVVDRLGPAAEVRAGGGLLRVRSFARLLADTIGRPLLVPRDVESTALGAAWLARLALGDGTVWQRCREVGGERVEPDPAAHAVYAAVANDRPMP